MATAFRRYRFAGCSAAELGYALAAAAITLWFLRHGWSAFDDGLYAWSARRLIEGAAPHRDIVMGHPGYASYIDAGLFSIFGNQLLALRYPLPILAAILVTAVARLTRSAGQVAQGVTAFAAISLGIVQFITPSAGWYASALAAAAVCVFCHAKAAEPASRTKLLVVTGILLGLCAGFRQYNGALLAAGLVVLQSLQGGIDSAARPSRWEQAISLTTLALALALLALPVLLAFSAGTFLLSLPVILCGACSLRTWITHIPARSTAWLMPIAAGCAIGFLPVVAIAMAYGALPELVDNTIVNASGYTGYSEIRGVNFTILLTDALEQFTKNGLYPRASGAYLLTIALLPLMLAALIYLRRSALREPAVAGIAVLAGISLLNNITFQGLIYAFYWLPAASAAVIVLSARGNPRSLVLLLVGGLAAFGLLFHAGRIPGNDWRNILSVPFPQQVPCALPNCDLYVDRKLRGRMAAEYQDVMDHVPSDRPLLVLPEGAGLYPLLPHRAPWNISFVIEGLTTDSEIAQLDLEIRRIENTAILVSRNYFSDPGRVTALDELIDSLCLVQQTPQFRIYAVCDAGPPPPRM